MNTIFDFVARRLPTSSVDTIVSVLVKVAERLAAAEAKQNAKAVALKKQADQLLSEAAAASAEAERAGRVALKLAGLTA